MGVKDWLKGLWSPEIEEEEPTFEDIEAETEKELEDRYSESMAEDLAAALEDFREYERERRRQPEPRAFEDWSRREQDEHVADQYRRRRQRCEPRT